MGKERITAFEDAILAIIMTILVLELNKPDQVTWHGLWLLHDSFFAYAISFFWIGLMWVSHHNNWHHVKVINMQTVYLTIVLLFLLVVIILANCLSQIIVIKFNGINLV